MSQNYELAQLASYALVHDKNSRTQFYDEMEHLLATGEATVPGQINQEMSEWAATPPARAAIIGRVALLEAFSPFAAFTQDMAERLRSEDAIQQESYMGGGAEAAVFSYPHDTDYVVRIIPDTGEQWFASERHEIVDGYVDGMLIGRGMPFLEQIVATSYQQSAVVSRLCPGATLSSALDLELAPTSHIEQFVKTLCKAIAKGIYIDDHPNNFIYDSASGFHCIDYSSLAHEGVKKQSVPAVISGIKTMSFTPEIDLKIGLFVERSLHAYDSLLRSEAQDDMM